MNVSIDTSQLVILEDFFKGLSQADQKKIFITGLRRAAKPLVESARRKVPVRTIGGGQLRRSIGTVENKENMSISVGTKLTGGRSKSGWYGVFFENSKTPVERFRRRVNGARVKKGQGSTGVMTKHAFMEPAYNEVREQMYDSVELEWYKAIDLHIMRVNRRLK